MKRKGPRELGRKAASPAQLPAVGTVATADELAELLNLSARRVRQLVELGMPRIAPGRYDVRKCARWYVAFLTRAIAARPEPQSPEHAGEVLGLLRAKRALRELTLGEQRGTVAQLDSVALGWEHAVEVLRARLLSAPSRLSTAFVDVADPEEARALLAAEVLGALAEAGRIARARS